MSALFVYLLYHLHYLPAFRHFSAEERQMAASAYPEFQSHKAEHDALAAEVVRLQADFKAGRVALTIKVLTFLKGWLQHHILGTDSKLGVHLKAIGHD